MKIASTIRTAAALFLAATATPAIAQPAAAPAQQAPAAAPDPERLAAAERVAAMLMPQGVYKRMIGENLGPMMDAMMGAMGDLPVSAIARATGISAADASALDKATMDQVMAIYDPHWRERMRRVAGVMTEMTAGIMDKMEPRARAALARIYAREFTAAELDALAAFFATPAGAHYAGKSLEIQMDPEMMKVATEAMPEMMGQLPAIVAKLEAATADLPPERGNGDLTAEERKKLAELLGIDPAGLEEQSGGEDEPL